MLWMMLKGVGIGLAVILPGMSAGTAALIFGIYDWLIRSLRRFKFIDIWPVLAGVIAGVLLGARAITGLLDLAPGIVLSFLLGLVLASAVLILKEAGPVDWTKLFIGLVGLSVTWLLGTTEVGAAVTGGTLFSVFVAGMLSSAAMVLPGISGSSMLVILGQYSRMLNAIVNWEPVPLAVFGAGAVVGLFGFAHVVAALLRHFRNHTMVALAGLMLGSTRALLPAHFGLAETAAAFAGSLLVVLFSQREG